MNALASLLFDDAARKLPPRKSDAVYHAVRRAILLGRLEPGAALLEQQIAAAMGCSQGTVREALIRLEQDGLVVRGGYRGTSVSETSEAEAELMARLRIETESRGAARAARLADDALFRRLEDLVARMADAEADRDGYRLSELDRMFHVSIVEAVGLRALVPVLTRCSLHVHRYIYAQAPAGRTPDNRAGLPSAPKRHRTLLEVLRGGAPQAAAAAMREHILEVIGSWAPALRERLLGSPGEGAAE